MAIKREKVIRTAEKLVARGKLEGAIKEYRKVLAENPNDANTLNRVGDLYARIERFDEAVKLFSQIAEQYTRDGFFVKAIAIYKKIIKLAPQSLQVYERLAELYHKQGLLNEARTQYQILGDHFEKQDNATSAIHIYQKMAAIDPDNPSHYLKLAQLFQGQQLNDKAIRAYRQLADLFLVSGSIDEATQVYLSALDAYSSEFDFVREVIRGLHDQGHVDAAQKVLEKAVTLQPEAEAIGREVFGVPEPEAEPLPSEPTEPELTLADPTGDPLEPSHSAPVVELTGFDRDDDGSVFTLDLDSDEPLATQVTPPSDMLDEPAEVEEIDIEIEPESLDEASPNGGQDSGIGEAPEEIDWSIDDIDQDDIDQDDIDQDDIDQDDVDQEIEIDLEEEEFGSVEIDLTDLDIDVETEQEAPPLVEPVDPPTPSASISPTTGSPTTGSPTTGSPTTGSPTTLARHEDDLLAEAKVFSKYGLREKAEDRLKELIGIQPEHLGGLSLLAQIDLAAGRQEEALERAREVARLARGSANPEPWNDLRDDLAKAGLTVEEDPDGTEPPKPATEDRFAQLLEDLDESATGLTVIPETEPEEIVALEPVLDVQEDAQAMEDVQATGEVDQVDFDQVEDVPVTLDDEVELDDEIESLDLEPLLEAEPEASPEPTTPEPTTPEPTTPEPTAPEPATSEPATPKTAPLDANALQEALMAGMGDETVAFDQSLFAVEEEIFDEEPVEAELPSVPEPQVTVPEPQVTVPEPQVPVSPEPDAGTPAAFASPPEPASTLSSNEEPFAEIEALMQSVHQAAGFEEFVPEETSLEELVPHEETAEDGETFADGSLQEAPVNLAAPPQAKVSLVDELGLEELDELRSASPPEESEPIQDAETVSSADAATAASELEETGMSWLDEVAPLAAESEEVKDSIFDEEDDFFDLAAELEAEMSGNGEIELETAQEQSLEEIIDGFKRGVAENLSSEDFGTHYELGIAYREMGLLDEAIGEFQLASKDPRRIVECSSMLGICFLDKGLPELAVRWYKKGLESPVVGEDQALGLLYDLASVYLTQGDDESAYRTFVEIYGMNSNYRDVAQRIQHLQEAAAS